MSTKYYAKHRKEQRAYHANYRVEHREERRAYQTQWSAAHREERRVSSATWAMRHCEEKRAQAAKWRVEHRKEWCALITNYKHRRRANGGNFPHAAWEHLKALFGHRCAYCGRRMERLTQDHIIPISKGGWHFSGNIVPACQSCNSRKGAKIPRK